MKILMIGSAQRYDANHNIYNKIASELEKCGEDVYRGYYLTTHNIDVNENDDKYFIVQNKQIQKFDYMRDNTEWINSSLKYKLIYLMRNPRYAIACMQQFIDEKRNGYFSAKRVDVFCEENNIDIVIGIVYPYHVAKIIASMKSPIKKYIVQLDPHAFNPTNKLQERKKLISEEKRVFDNITKLFTTSYIKKDLLTIGDFEKRKDDIVEIEFPLIEERSINHLNNTEHLIKRDNESQIAFLHAGRFYEDIRNPRHLAHLFKMLPNNCILYLAGSNAEDAMKYFEGIENRVMSLGVLSQEEVSRVRNDVDFLISYNNPVSNMVPSKLFECINSGMPFINLCQITNCPTLDYVSNYEMSYTVFVDSMDKQIDGLNEFILNYKGKRIDSKSIMDMYMKCTVKYVTEQILDNINIKRMNIVNAKKEFYGHGKN